MKKLLNNIFVILILFTIALFLIPTLYHLKGFNNSLMDGPIIYYTSILFVLFFSSKVVLTLIEASKKHNN
ncbi:hypothetical protein [Clostridium sardiniense]|uniref:hypothetical protein n=1 Tax=Clostridium sardiniense TaxID=29369 RepID=UPI003D32EE9B